MTLSTNLSTSLTHSSIRILKILPGLPDDTVSCELKHVPRQDDGYVCLSYMWGDESDCHPITVNGKRHLVRRNLWNFLRLARKLKISDWLWIDAVCIDQSNIDERNHQVQQMAAIYKGAKHVLVYPGHIPRQLQITAFLAHHSHRAGVPVIKWYEQVSNSYKLARLRYKLTRFVDLQRSSKLLTASELPYWKRTWIIQEILLSKECFVITDCGMIRWCRFQFMYDHCEVFLGEDNSEAGLLSDVSSGGWTPGGRDFSHLLQMSDSSHCSDIRDRLYGLLGLAPECEGFAVDYRRSSKMLLLDFLEHLFLKSYSLSKLQKVMEILEFVLEVNVKAACRKCARSIDLDPVAVIEDRDTYPSFVQLYVQDGYVENEWGMHGELRCETCGLTALPRARREEWGEREEYGEPDRFLLFRTADDRLNIHYHRQIERFTPAST